MQSNKIVITRIGVVGFVLLVNIFVFYTIVNATGETELEHGQLRINSHVISDTREEITQHSSIGFEVAPFLFLENMTEIEASRVQADENRLTHAKNSAFSDFDIDVDDRLETSEIIATLFQETEGLSEVRQFETTYTLHFETPVWLWTIIGIVSMLLLGYIGILLGKKVSHLIYKKKTLNEAGEVNE